MVVSPKLPASARAARLEADAVVPHGHTKAAVGRELERQLGRLAVAHPVGHRLADDSQKRIALGVGHLDARVEIEPQAGAGARGELLGDLGELEREGIVVAAPQRLDRIPGLVESSLGRQGHVGGTTARLALQPCGASPS